MSDLEKILIGTLIGILMPQAVKQVYIIIRYIFRFMWFPIYSTYRDNRPVHKLEFREVTRVGDFIKRWRKYVTFGQYEMSERESRKHAGLYSDDDD